MVSETMHIHGFRNHEYSWFQEPLGPTKVIKQIKIQITFGSFVIAAAKCDCLRVTRITPNTKLNAITFGSFVTAAAKCDCLRAIRIIFHFFLKKVDFGTKWTHMDATDVPLAQTCAEFRSGSNGTGPGAQNPDLLSGFPALY
mgnify:CR=1 FL=1